MFVEHDVVRLDVAVDDAAAVGVGECTADVDENLANLRRGECPAPGEHAGERLAAQELHDEVDHPPALADAVDGDDAGVLELGGGAGFALEALDELLVERQREGKDFDGDVALELALARLEDDRHAPAPELVEDFVLLFELLPNHVDFGQLRLAGLDGAGRSGRGQIQPARAAELAAVFVWRAAAGAIHPVSEGTR